MKIEASCLLRMGGSFILGMKGAVGIRLATANNAVARRLLRHKKTIRITYPCYGTTRLKFAEEEYVYINSGSISEGRQALEDLALWPVTEQIAAEVSYTHGGATRLLRAQLFRGRIR